MAGRRVTIENGRGAELQGRLFEPQQPKGSAALFVHDHGSLGLLNEQYAEQAMDLGITGLTFDLGGHGENPGEDVSQLSVEDHLSDVKAAYDFLAEKENVDAERIGIAGMSYGAYLAALAVSDRQVRSLLLRMPSLYPDALRTRPRADYDDMDVLVGTPETDNPALSNLRVFAGRVLLITRPGDMVVSSAVTGAYEDAAQNVETWKLNGDGHLKDSEFLHGQHGFGSRALGWAVQL